ncbi:MAG: DnaJ domain-containing protein [Euzebyales bacterium]|jgi:hypothetical protein|nr:DnaJ domain-containing protein [Euzebyales bacterium]
MVTHYEVLGVDPDATESEIRAAYSAAIWPARARSDAARERALQEALTVLCGTDSRTTYDESLDPPEAVDAVDAPAPAPEAAAVSASSPQGWSQPLRRPGGGARDVCCSSCCWGCWSLRSARLWAGSRDPARPRAHGGRLRAAGRGYRHGGGLPGRPRQRQDRGDHRRRRRLRGPAAHLRLDDGSVACLRPLVPAAR